MKNMKSSYGLLRTYGVLISRQHLTEPVVAAESARTCTWRLAECGQIRSLRRIALYFGLYVVTLGGHHHGGDLINPLFIHIYFTSLPYNTVLILDSNRLENCLLSQLTWTDLVHALRVCWIQIAPAIDPNRLYRWGLTGNSSRDGETPKVCPATR